MGWFALHPRMVKFRRPFTAIRIASGPTRGSAVPAIAGAPACAASATASATAAPPGACARRRDAAIHGTSAGDHAPGTTATPHGRLPTGTVATTSNVVVSTTETSFEGPFAV